MLRRTCCDVDKVRPPNFVRQHDYQYPAMPVRADSQGLLSKSYSAESSDDEEKSVNSHLLSTTVQPTVQAPSKSESGALTLQWIGIRVRLALWQLKTIQCLSKQAHITNHADPLHESDNGPNECIVADAQVRSV
jgi:hypothetical protein